MKLPEIAHLCKLFKIYYILFFVCSAQLCFAQDKFEKESRLSTERVPSQALEFVEAFSFPGKIKWFKEESLTGNSIEAKTRFNTQKWSIEFDTSGFIEDIEIEIDYSEISSSTKKAIDQYLESNFDKHQVCKTQRQFSGQSNALKQFDPKQVLGSTDQIQIRYELVVKVKQNKKHKQIELLFDESGILLNESTIIFQNTDNLEF